MAGQIDPLARAIGLFDELDGSDSPGLDDEQSPMDPIGKFFEQARFRPLTKSSNDFVDASWFEPVARGVEKRGTPVTFSKGTMGHKLGIVRQEEKVDGNGEKWIHSFNAAGEMVDARVIDSSV